MPAPSAESRGGEHLPPWRADLSLYLQGLSPHLYRIKKKITACFESLLPSPFTAPAPHHLFPFSACSQWGRVRNTSQGWGWGSE